MTISFSCSASAVCACVFRSPPHSCIHNCVMCIIYTHMRLWWRISNMVLLWRIALTSCHTRSQYHQIYRLFRILYMFLHCYYLFCYNVCCWAHANWILTETIENMFAKCNVGRLMQKKTGCLFVYANFSIVDLDEYYLLFFHHRSKDSVFGRVSNTFDEIVSEWTFGYSADSKDACGVFAQFRQRLLILLRIKHINSHQPRMIQLFVGKK